MIRKEKLNAMIETFSYPISLDDLIEKLIFIEKSENKAGEFDEDEKII